MDAQLIKQNIDSAETMLTELKDAAATLQAAIEMESKLRRTLKETEQALEQAEADIVYMAEIEAHGKTGPLAGIAKTSPAYKAALTRIVTQARGEAGQISTLAQQVAVQQARHDQALIEREQASVYYSACKHAADLKTAILKAVVL
jgi:hypothetical protein